MARRYVGVARMSNGNKLEDVGVEVRAKNEASARGEVAKVLSVAYPNTEPNASICVSRLKERDGVWEPVKAYLMGALPGITTWLAPKDVEITDIRLPKDNVVQLPMVTTKEKKVKGEKSKSFTTKWKDIKLGITEGVLKEMAHNIRTYNATNEVES